MKKIIVLTLCAVIIFTASFGVCASESVTETPVDNMAEQEAENPKTGDMFVPVMILFIALSAAGMKTMSDMM